IGADSDTLIAAVIYSTGQPLPDDASPSVRRLLEGQLSASRVWSIHAGREGQQGAEGLRRLLLAIIGDLRVVLILLARQLVEMRGSPAGGDAGGGALARVTTASAGPAVRRHPCAAGESTGHLAAEMGAGRSGLPLPAAGHVQAHRAPARREAERPRGVHRVGE